MAVKINDASNFGNLSGKGSQLVRDSSGDLWCVLVDDTNNDLEIWRSTDNGATWTEQDSADSPTANGDSAGIAIDSSDVLHIVYSPAASAVSYVTFSGGNWGSPTTIASDAGFNFAGFSVAVDSNDKVHTAYSFSDSGTSNGGGVYQNNVSGSWTSRISLGSGTNDTADCYIFIDNSDIPIVALDYDDGSSGSTQMKKGNANNASSFSSSTLAGNISSTVVGAVDSSNNVWAAYLATGNQIMLAKQSSNWTSTWEIYNTGLVVTSGNKVGLFIDGTDMYIFYEDANNDIAYKKFYPPTTYYFDGSDAAASDPNSVWTNDANAFDGNTGTFASSTTVGSTSSNYLMAEGTNAPSSGDTVAGVSARVWADLTFVVKNAAIYTDGLAQLLGTPTGGVNAYGNYAQLTVPTGGWTWAKVQSLETKLYFTNNPDGGAARFHRVEVSVLTSDDAVVLQTGTYQDPKVSWAMTNLYGSSANGSVADSYPTSNQDNITVFGSTSAIRVGQSFTGNGGNLTRAQFYLSNTGSGAAPVYARLYAHSGTFGTSSVGTGAALATSQPVSPSSIGSSLSLINFIFDGSYTLANGTNYVIAVEKAQDGPSAGINVGYDSSSPAHGGNYIDYESIWTAVNTRDVIFYVHTGPTTGIIRSLKTYYFDGSDASATDPNSAWTNDANAFDSSISTSASSAVTSTGSVSTNYLMAQGTNAPSSGGTITRVSARIRGNDSDDMAGQPVLNAAVYTDSLGELLGTATLTTTLSLAYGSYVSLSTPSGGWTWAKVQALETKVYITGAALDQVNVARVEILVETSDPASEIDYLFSDNTDVFYDKLSLIQSQTLSTDLFEATFETAIANYTVSHSTDAVKGKRFTATHTTDALKRKQNTLSHTTDSNKKKVVTASHSTDSFLRKAQTVSHTTDANRKKANLTLSHTTDANKKKSATLTHTTDSNKKKADNTLTHTTDANKKKLTTRTHTTDSNIVPSDNLDQFQPHYQFTVNFGYASVKKVAQEFVPSATGRLQKIITTIANAFEATDEVTAHIYDDNSGEPGSLLATSTNSFDGSAHPWTDPQTTFAFDFDESLIITLSTSYWMVFERTGALDGGNTFMLRQSTGDPYPAGATRYLNPSDVWADLGDDIQFYQYTLVPLTDTETHTTDALKRKANTLTHTTDSFLRKAQTVAHTTDSNKKKADNVVTHTTDSLKRTLNTVSHTTDANLDIGVSTETITHTTDSFLRTQNTRTHTTDAFLRRQLTVSHTTDSNKKKANNTVVHTTDSNKRLATVKTHTTDANKKKANLTVSHTTDSFLRKTNTVSHTTDTLKRTQNTLTHSTDSFIRKANTLSHTTDSNKKRATTVSHTTDSNLKKSTTASHTTDSLKRTRNTLSHTTDSNKRKVNTLTHTTDARKVYPDFTTTVVDNFNDNSINTDLWDELEFTGTVTEQNNRMELVLTTGASAPFDAAALHTKSGRFFNFVGQELTYQVITYPNNSQKVAYAFVTIGITRAVSWSYLNGNLRAIYNTGSDNILYTVAYSSTYSWQRIREDSGTIYFDTSSDGVNWTNRASQVPSGTLFLDGVYAGFEIDPTTTTTSTGNFFFDNVNIGGQFTKAHTTDALVRKSNILTHSTDSNKRKATVVSHTTDALKRAESTLTHTTDSFLRKANTVSHTTDANKRKVTTLSHTTDANKKKADNTVVHTTDSNKRKIGTLTHTTDSFLRDQNTLSHTTDSFLREQNTLSHTADSNKRKANTASHSTDSLLRKANVVSHTTDSNKRTTGLTVSHTTDAKAHYVGTVWWVTPLDNAVGINGAEPLVFEIPSAITDMHFHLQIDTVNTFDGGDFVEFKSWEDQTNWEYWDGDSWEPIPSGGVDPSFAGNEARFTPSLSNDDYYRRIRGRVLI